MASGLQLGGADAFSWLEVVTDVPYRIERDGMQLRIVDGQQPDEFAAQLTLSGVNDPTFGSTYPGFSQGDTVAELEENIRDAYELVLEDEVAERRNGVQLKEIEQLSGALTHGFSPSSLLDCSSGLTVGNRTWQNYESAAYGPITMPGQVDVIRRQEAIAPALGVEELGAIGCVVLEAGFEPDSQLGAHHGVVDGGDFIFQRVFVDAADFLQHRRARQRLARAKAQAKKRRSERKPVKKSFEAFARR